MSMNLLHHFDIIIGVPMAYNGLPGVPALLVLFLSRLFSGVSLFSELLEKNIKTVPASYGARHF